MNTKKISATLFLVIFGLSMLSFQTMTIRADTGAILVPQSAGEAVLTNSTPAPNVDIQMTRDGVNTTLTLQTIIEYIQNETIPLVGINETDDETNETTEWKGVNPLHLCEIVGWKDAWNLSIYAADGFAAVHTAQDLILRDPDFYKYSDYEATMICFAANSSWLKVWDSDLGDFAVKGDGLSGKQRPSNVVGIEFQSEWNVAIKVNGEVQGYLAKSNKTATGLNYTYYDWGYSANYSWDVRKCTGVTVASIINTITNASKYNYNVSFIAADGYGTTKVFTRTDILSGKSGVMVDNGTDGHQDELMSMGKQPMLAIAEDDEELGYSAGAFELVVPGASKSDYIKQIVEIQITADFSDLIDGDEESGIPGFDLTIMITLISVGSFLLVRKSRKQ